MRLRRDNRCNLFLAVEDELDDEGFFFLLLFLFMRLTSGLGGAIDVFFSCHSKMILSYYLIPRLTKIFIFM